MVHIHGVQDGHLFTGVWVHYDTYQKEYLLNLTSHPS